MKKSIFLIALCLISTLLSCNVENVLNDQSVTSKKANGKKKEATIIEGDNISTENPNEHCKTVNLIAGQNEIAGVVTIDIDGDNLIITYLTNSDWTIKATHLHITNCVEDSFPLTGSNNPKIGNFDYSSTHKDGVTEVTYIFDLNKININEEFCFAAHAEVNGPSQETAWAEGEDFGGKSWAMFVEANLIDCDGDDDEVTPAF
tara:strand:+ start:1028 stop:1636 length:609 start_codon:yes stop_codon:yes gene_type:complete